MEESNAEMQRGMAQVLSSFTPGAVFSYGQEGFSMQVDDWKTERIDSIDGQRVANRIAGAISEFRNSDDAPWDDLDNTVIEMHRPTEVQGDFFPKTMVCRKCKGVFRPKNSKHLAKTNGICQQSDCNGQLKQIQFVLVHDCGALTNIEPRPCAKSGHGWDDVYLKRGDPDDMTTFSFRCRKCREDTKALKGQCSRCDDWVSSARPLQSGSVYYPHREVMVDIPPVGTTGQDLRYDEDWARVLMHAHIGKLDLSQDGITLEQVATRAGIDEEQLASIEDDLENVSPEIAENIIEALGDASSNGPGRVEVVKQNKQYIDLPADPRRHARIAHELFTFQRATNGYEGNPAEVRNIDRHPVPRSLSEFVDDENFVRRYRQAGLYRDLLDDLNIVDAWVVDSFPLLSVVYGYSRDEPDARRVDLREFESVGSSDALTVFGDRSPSEAIVLEIDRGAIVEWLLEAGELNGADAPDLDNEVELKSWFLENVDPTEIENPFTKIEDETTEQVYQLLHTASHALMGTASEQCGLDSDSISELILPTVPAIVLYAESMEHFALGGMFTLFKTRLHNWVDRAKEHANQCIYDPACMDDESAACHACMHVSEFTCEFFNNTLDRAVLIGDGEHVPAFWEISDNEF